MSIEEVLEDLLSLWQHAQADGREVSANELCRDHPELLAELQGRIEAVRQMNQFLEGVNRQTLSFRGGQGTNPEPTQETGPVSASASLPAAAQPPGYEILGELGRGGMGVVYKARQTQLNRVVALKVLRAGGLAGSEELARFRSEAVARLQHPNIVQVFEVGEQEGWPFFSLEFCPGGSLDRRLAGTPLAARLAAGLLETLSRAVEAAHQSGIVHRDLKPANILLAGGPDWPLDRGTPKITDFGLAKQLDVESNQTRSGAIMGTPSYMAPEQAAGRTRDIGPLSDVYALGAILYECLTGRPPFKAATVMETIEQVWHADPVPPRRLQPGVPRDLETICLKCIAKEPQRRYPSAQALADDLKRFLANEPIQARRVGLAERTLLWARRRPTAAALAAVLAAVGLALPLGAVQLAAQVSQRRAAEQKHLQEARSEVHDLRARGQTASQSQDWKQAEMLLDQALDKIDAEPRLADLRIEVEAVRGPLKERLAALENYQRFVRDRDEALFHATLAGGEDLLANRRTATDRARSALAVFSLSERGQGTLQVPAACSPEEKAEITTGSYALLLTLAEIESRRLPQQTDREHRRQLRQALELLDRAEGLGVRTRAIHLRRSRYLTLLGDAATAARESERVQALASETNLDPHDHFLVGHEFYSQGNLTRANQEFRRALQLDARHFWTHYFLGLCHVTAGQPEVAVAHLTLCQGQQPRLIWIYLLRGFALGQMEDYPAAERDFDRALALQPSPATLYVLYNNRGVMRVGQKGAWAQGVEDLKQAAALRPDQHQAPASLAEAYRLVGRLDEAGQHLDLAIALAQRQVQGAELKPAVLAQLHHSRARLHLQRQDRQAAVRDLEEAARLAETEPALRARAEADRGRVLHLQEKLEEALAAYDSALKSAPGRLDVLRWRGEVLLVLRRYAEAEAAFAAHLEKGGPPSVAVHRQRGLARAKLGRHAEAIDDYGRALQGKPREDEQLPLYLARGQEYLALNALPPALADFEEALRLAPGHVDALLGRAHARVKLGDPSRAVADADRTLRGQPREPRLWHGAARVYAQAAGQVKAESGQEQFQAQLRTRYLQRAVVLLRTALELVPAGQRPAYWQEQVLKDTALYPIRRELGELSIHFGR